MSSAREHDIIQPRIASVGPMLDVVDVGMADAAAWKRTTTVPRLERPAQSDRNRPPLAAHVERSSPVIVAHHDQPRIAREPARRLRGNV